MKLRNVVVVPAALAFVLPAYRAIFPRLIRFDIELAGMSGAEVAGSAECDGVVRSFATTLPATLSFEARRSFLFGAQKKDQGVMLSMRMTAEGDGGNGGQTLVPRFAA
ncbi:MAG TPA: hypothetical protein VHO24_12740 [Opitutaceae bacterium]|nr:hypothetical protein [Opitutaceae bacterium]